MKNLKKIVYLLLISLIIYPQMVYASTGYDGSALLQALLFELFITIFMCAFVFYPIFELYNIFP